MHPSRRESYGARLRSIARDAISTLTGHERPWRGFNLDSENPLYLIGAVLGACDALVQDLLSKERWAAKWSERYVRERIEGVISRVRAGADPSEEIGKLGTQFSTFADSYRVLMPLAGVVLDTSDIQIGNVILRKGAEVAGDLTARISAAGQVDLDDEIKLGLSEFTVAEYSIVADPERAAERALDETRRCIDFLRFLIATEPRWSDSVQVGFCHDVGGSEWTMFVTGTQFVHLLKSFASPARRAYHIDSHSVHEFARLGLDSLAEALARNTATRFDRILARAIHWFSDAQVQRESEGQLLSLVTALETLFTPPKVERIRLAIAEGAAQLIGEAYNDRIWLRNRVLGLYSKRSEISHGG